MLRRPFSTTDCLKPGLVPIGCYGLVQETGKREPGASLEVCVSSGFPDIPEPVNSPPWPPLPQIKTKETVGRDFTSPIKAGSRPQKDSQAILYPDLRSRKSMSALSRTPFGNQHQSQGTDVEIWLENVPDSPRLSSRHRMGGSSFDIAAVAPSPIGLTHGSQRSSPTRPSRYRLPAAASSEKENISPSKIPVATWTSSPAKSVASYPRLPNAILESDLGIKKTPTRNMGNNSGAAIRCPPPPTPRGHMTDTTKEKWSPPGFGSNMPTPRNRESFVIHDEESAFPSAELSLNIECRRGHGPTRKR
ncbi:MAG: hypothetical protein Q9214_007871, partial [Letrouitia sp. 1 TL-2023]